MATTKSAHYHWAPFDGRPRVDGYEVVDPLLERLIRYHTLKDIDDLTDILNVVEK